MSTNFPSGLSSYGVPVLGAGPIFTTGNIFFVQSTNALADDSPSHGSKRRPFATMDYAVSKCTAGNGDYIVAMPGHVETITAAGGLDLDVAGISLVGIGRGTYQPQIKLGTVATSDVDIDEANVSLNNFNLVANFADVAVMIDVNATDFSIFNCRFTQAGANLNGKICIQDAAAAGSDRITIENCQAIMYDAENTHFVNFAGTGTGHRVVGNTLIGDWGTMAVGGAGVITYATITDNVIYNAATTTDGCINFAATATGICMRNLCGGGAAQANGVTATAMAIAQNYYGVISEDLSAILDPIAT